MKNYTVWIIGYEQIMCDYYYMVLYELEGQYPIGRIDCYVHHDQDTVRSLFLDPTADQSSVDLVLLDLKPKIVLGKHTDHGQDLGRLVRRELPGTKLVLLSHPMSEYRLHHILATLNPEGLLIRDEIGERTELQKAIRAILSGSNQYTDSILTFLKSEAYGPKMEQKDRELLYYLGEGVRSKDLPEYMHLSLSTIERRKREIARLLDVADTNSQELVQRARDLGII